MTARKAYGGAVLLGFAIGLTFGQREVKQFIEFTGWVENSSAQAAYSQLAFLEDAHSSPAQSRAALLGFIDFTRTTEALPEGERDKSLFWNRGSAYVRLARLELKSGNADLARQYSRLAFEAYRSTGRRVSEQDVAKAVETSLH